LDRLVFSRDEGTVDPAFDDYYPSRKAYYEQLTPTTPTTTAPPPEPG
jgi:hypothetical protein